jgi:hypothetical protein
MKSERFLPVIFFDPAGSSAITFPPSVKVEPAPSWPQFSHLGFDTIVLSPVEFQVKAKATLDGLGRVFNRHLLRLLFLTAACNRYVSLSHSQATRRTLLDSYRAEQSGIFDINDYFVVL